MKPKDAFGRYGCVPREMHPAWQRVSHYARTLGKELISRIDDFDAMQIATSGDWETSLCMTLTINGADRRNAKGAMRSLVSAGLMTVEEGFVRLHLDPVVSREGLHSASTRIQSCPVPVSVSDPDSTQVPENNQLTSDSKQAIKASKQSVESARVRPDLFGFNWYCSTLELLPTSAPAPGSWRDQYAFMGSKPEAERSTVAAEMRADAWIQANKHLVTPEYVRKFWTKLLGGGARTVLKPVVATPREQLDKARERLRAARIEVNRLDGLPWFDRESPKFPARRERAAAEVTAATAALAELERGGAQAVAS